MSSALSATTPTSASIGSGEAEVEDSEEDEVDEEEEADLPDELAEPLAGDCSARQGRRRPRPRPEATLRFKGPSLGFFLEM